jgi:hypothetical protein
MFATFACLVFIASFDEFNLGAEALVRVDTTPDREYVVKREDYPGIVAINNYFDNCKSGKDTCVMRAKKLMEMKANGQKISMHGKRTTPKIGAKATWNVSCGGTVIGRRHIISARHCFCADPTGSFGYTSGFYVWVAKRKYKVKRTFVPRGCGWTCHETGHPNQCDIAIMELDRSITHVKPYKLYNPKRCSRRHSNGMCAKHFGSELHKNLEFLGWGVPGVASSSNSKLCEDGALDGKMRKGMNTVLSLGHRFGTSWGRHKDHVLKFMMRGGSNPKLCKLFPFTKFAGLSRCHPGEGLRLEAITSSGDSGTPAFIRMRDDKGREEAYLAGIDTSGDKTSATDVNTCGYGAVDEFSRVSKFSNFIKHVMSGRYKKRGKKFGRTYEPWTMTKRAPHMNFAPFGHAKYKKHMCRLMMEQYWTDNVSWDMIRMCGKNTNTGKRNTQVKNELKAIAKKIRAGKDPSDDVYEFHKTYVKTREGKYGRTQRWRAGAMKALAKKAMAKKAAEATTSVHVATTVKTKKVKQAKLAKAKKSKKAMHKQTTKHIKQAVNSIVNLASRKGFAKWKKLQKGHMNKSQMNHALENEINKATDAQFHKLHLPKNVASVPEFELINDMHDDEHHTAEDIQSRTQTLKAHFESQIKSLSTLMKHDVSI